MPTQRRGIAALPGTGGVPGRGSSGTSGITRAAGNSVASSVGVAYRGDMMFRQIKATRHGYENPCSPSGAAMLREDSQLRTGVVAT